MRALVTGFDPFGGEPVNASREAVRRLSARIGAIDVVTAELPTSYARSLAALEHAIARAAPDLVLCVGQAGERMALCVERVAVNARNARIADNDGAQPVDVPVIAGGPAAYFATLPVRAAVAALRAAGLPAEISYSAGTFVCNHVFYGLMHLAERGGHPFRGGFLHVPCLPQLPLEEIVRGVRIVLEVAADTSARPSMRWEGR